MRHASLVGNGSRRRLEVVDAAAVPVVRPTQQKAEFLVLAETLANGAIVGGQPTSPENVCITSLPFDLIQRPLARSFGH